MEYTGGNIKSSVQQHTPSIDSYRPTSNSAPEHTCPNASTSNKLRATAPCFYTPVPLQLQVDGVFDNHSTYSNSIECNKGALDRQTCCDHDDSMIACEATNGDPNHTAIDITADTPDDRGISTTTCEASYGDSLSLDIQPHHHAANGKTDGDPEEAKEFSEYTQTNSTQSYAYIKVIK